MSTLYFPGVKTARDANNNVVPFAKRYVYAAQSDVLRPIFEDSGLTGMLGNPLVADAAGTFPLVHLLSGSYRVVDEDPRGTRLNEVTDLHIAPIFRTGDAHCFPTRAALLADDLLSYSATDSNSAVAAGMHIQVAQGGWIFEVAPDTASDAAYTTGGGLRLYEAGTVYTTKARFLAALARGIQFDVGATVLAEGTLYRFADDGNTDLTGLAGWTQGGISDALDLRLGALETNVGQALAASGAAVFADRAALLASPTHFAAGSTLTTQRDGRAYVVALAEHDDATLTTAGGVPLYEAGPYSSLRELARTAGQSGDHRVLQAGARSGTFTWQAGNHWSKITKDPLGGVYVAPASDTSGASGCWQRIHNGAIRAEWFGATGGADDTDAVQACDEFLREFTEAKTWLVSGIHTTRGFGDILTKATYATRAEADTDLPTLSEYDVITVTADETQGGTKRRYRVRDGVFVGPLSGRAYNGKRIEGVGVGKRNGFKLMAGSPAWMRLLAGSFSDGSIERIVFHGNHPSAQWGGTQANPDTDLLVEIEGYGFSWRDNVVRFSGGNGVQFQGIVGSFEWSGGDCVSQYNMGWGVVIGQMSSFRATKMWVEGNETGDILMKYDIDESTMTSQKFNTSTAYWKQSNVAIESIYSENSSEGSVVVQVEGGHFAPRIGQIANWDSTGDRTTIYLKNNADASGVFRGCKGGYFDLGGVLGAKIVCEDQSWNNTFVRSGGLPTTIENDAWNVQDAGRDNLFVWAEADATAFVPGGDPGNVAVNLGASNFVNNAGGNARLSVAPGGVIGPVQDYHYNHPAGPSHVVASGMNYSEGEGELNTTLSLNATLPATVAQWYAVIVLAANAGQQVRIGVKDQGSGAYFNWHQRTWTSPAGADDFGIYRVLRADRSHLAYALPFENDGTAREIRIQVRMAGGGTADLYHAFVTDRPNPALGGVLAGQWLGTPGNAMCNSVRRPPADAMPIGTRVWNVSDSELQISDGAAWLGTMPSPQ